MSWHYLPELVGAFSGARYSAGVQLERWKSNPIAAKSCCAAKGTACYPCFQSGTTSEPLMVGGGAEKWISSLPGSRVSPSPSLVAVKAQATNTTSGPRPSECFAKYDPPSRSWKTFQVSLLTHTLEPFKGTWPRAGMLDRGTAYRRQTSARTIAVGGSGGFWPTPSAANAEQGGAKAYRQGGIGLTQKVNAEKMAGGQLNPPWVEWLMGWPIGWTDLRPLETGRFQEWCEQHGICSTVVH